MVNKYIPSPKDLVWINFSNTKGHEQKGKRPALIISPFQHNKTTNLAIMCPITTTVKDYPFEVKLRTTKQINGVILTNQIRTFDWNKRKVKFIEKISNQTMEKVMKKLSLLINKEIDQEVIEE